MKKRIILTGLILATSALADKSTSPTIPEKFHGYWSSIKSTSIFPTGIKISESQTESYTISEELSFNEPFKVNYEKDGKFMLSASTRTFSNIFSLSKDTLIIISQYHGMDTGKPTTYKYLKAEGEPKSEYTLIPESQWPKKLTNSEGSLEKKNKGFSFLRSKQGMSLALATKKATKAEDQVFIWKLSHCEFPYLGCKKFSAVRLYKHNTKDDYTFEYSTTQDTPELAIEKLNRSNGGTMRGLKTK